MTKEINGDDVLRSLSCKRCVVSRQQNNSAHDSAWNDFHAHCGSDQDLRFLFEDIMHCFDNAMGNIGFNEPVSTKSVQFFILH